jgi:hypothetical protein
MKEWNWIVLNSGDQVGRENYFEDHFENKKNTNW